MLRVVVAALLLLLLRRLCRVQDASKRSAAVLLLPLRGIVPVLLDVGVVIAIATVVSSAVPGAGIVVEGRCCRVLLAGLVAAAGCVIRSVLLLLLLLLASVVGVQVVRGRAVHRNAPILRLNGSARRV